MPFLKLQIESCQITDPDKIMRTLAFFSVGSDT